MDVPLYALEGGLGAMNMEKAIEVQLIKNLSRQLENVGITERGVNVPLTTDLSAGETGFGSLGKWGAWHSFWGRLFGKRKKQSDKAKSKLQSVSKDLLGTRLQAKKAEKVEIMAAKRGDVYSEEEARVLKSKLQGKEQFLKKKQKAYAEETVAPKLKKSQVIQEAMPEIRKAARSIAAGIRNKAREARRIVERKAASKTMREFGLRQGRGQPRPLRAPDIAEEMDYSSFNLRGLGKLPAVTTTPYDIVLPQARSPMNNLLYPSKGLDYGLGQFRTIDPVVDMDIQGMGAFETTAPPFNEHEFASPRTEAEWSQKYESEEVAEVFPVGMGDASESAQSDDWSKPNNTFPGYRSQRWDFDQNVIGQRAPTKENVKRLVRGGIKAAMRTIDQTGSVEQMNANLRKFGIQPKPEGQPFTTAGNVAYRGIVRGLARKKIISTAAGEPADVKVKPKKFRKVLDAGLRKERQLRNKRRRYLRWLGR